MIQNSLGYKVVVFDVFPTPNSSCYENKRKGINSGKNGRVMAAERMSRYLGVSGDICIVCAGTLMVWVIERDCCFALRITFLLVLILFKYMTYLGFKLVGLSLSEQSKLCVDQDLQYLPVVMYQYSTCTLYSDQNCKITCIRIGASSLYPKFVNSNIACNEMSLDSCLSRSDRECDRVTFKVSKNAAVNNRHIDSVNRIPTIQIYQDIITRRY